MLDTIKKTSFSDAELSTFEQIQKDERYNQRVIQKVVTIFAPTKTELLGPFSSHETDANLPQT